MRHDVQPHVAARRRRDSESSVTRRVGVAAARDVEHRARHAARPLRHEIDRAADRARTRVDGVRAGDELELLEIEWIRAAVLRAVAHAVGRDVARRGVAAKVDAVAVAAAAFAGRERDAGQRRQDVAHRQQVLLIHDLARHERDRLRSLEQRRRVARAQSLLEPLAEDLDDFARGFLLVARRARRRRLLRLHGSGREAGGTEPSPVRVRTPRDAANATPRHLRAHRRSP